MNSRMTESFESYAILNMKIDLRLCSALLSGHNQSPGGVNLPRWRPDASNYRVVEPLGLAPSAIAGFLLVQTTGYNCSHNRWHVI